MAPRLHHAPLGEHDHAIGDLGGAQPVGHQEHRPPGDEPPETGGDLLLLRGVHRGEGVVEDEDRRRGHERPGERHALALPARQREPALAHHRRVARGEPLDLLRDAGRRRRRAHARLVDLLPSEGDVVLEGTREEETLLGDVAEPGAEVRERQLRHVALADEDGARRRLPEPREQQAERGLAGPGRSDDRDRLAGGDLEADGAQGGRPALEGEREVREPDRERAPVLSRRARGRRDGIHLGPADDLVDALEGREAAAHDRQRPAERDRGPREVREVAVERDERAEAQAAVHDCLTAGPEEDQRAHAGDQPHQRRERRLRPRQREAPAQVLPVRAGEVRGRPRLERVGPNHRHPGDVLLHARREDAELLLRRLGALVDDGVEALREQDEAGVRGQRPEGEPRVRGEHGSERAGEREDRPDEAHRAEAHERAHRGDVARRARHQLARGVLRVEPRREGLKARVEVVAQVVLEPLGAADDREARAEPRDPVRRRQEHDDAHVRAEPGRRRVGPQGVDRALHREGDRQRGERRGSEAEDAERVAAPVPQEASPERAARSRQRPPAACGASAA